MKTTRRSFLGRIAAMAAAAPLAASVEPVQAAEAVRVSSGAEALRVQATHVTLTGDVRPYSGVTITSDLTANGNTTLTTIDGQSLRVSHDDVAPIMAQIEESMGQALDRAWREWSFPVIPVKWSDGRDA